MATKYNTRFQLTACPAINRWRKKYHGKIYYIGIGHCSNKTDRAGYAIALAEWKVLKAKLDNAPTEEETTRYNEIQANKEAWRVELPEKLQQGFKASLAENDRIVAKVEGRKARKDSIGANVETFIALKRSRHNLGELSALRIQTLMQHLNHFQKFIGAETPIHAITEETYIGYRASLITEIQAGKIGRATASDRLNCFKEFVRSLYQIERPKNLDNRDLSIKIPAMEVATFTDEELKTLLDSAPEKFGLWILLMLNCGMYQGDIAELKPTEVDWETGIITRKRSKEKNQPNAPIVSYKLWDRTFALLKKYGKQSGDRVFTNHLGNPLVERAFKNSGNGKLKNQDCIYQAYRYLVPDKSRKPLKAIRKTGASTLAKHPQFKWYADYYLGHSPKGMAEKHYIKPDDSEFFQALAWLGEQFGIK